MIKKINILKVISVILVSSLIAEQISYANPDLKPAKLDLFSKQKIDLGIPESTASVEDSWRSGDASKTIYLIQDAHTNTSGQMNLAKTLQQLLLKDKKIKYLFVEAGFGNSSLSFLRQYGTEEQRKNIAEPFLRNGELHGEEYLDLISGRDFILWGVESLELYKKSIEDYRFVAQERTKFENYLARIQSTIDTLKPKIYNPLLLSLDASREKFRRDELPLSSYVEILAAQAKACGVDIAGFPELNKLKDLKAEEAKIDFVKAAAEQERAVLGLPAETQKELLSLAQENGAPSKLMQSEHQEKKMFYALFEEKLGADISAYPELAKYLSYLKLTKKIKAADILKEAKAVESGVFERSAVTDDEKNLSRAQDAAHCLEKLFRLTMTPEEYREYKALTAGFGITRLTGFLNKKIMDVKIYYDRAVYLESGYEDVVGHAEAFYESTFSRDIHFVEETIAKMEAEAQGSAVLITGGFHTPNLKSLLKQKGISYFSLTPQISAETNQKRYEDILLGQQALLQTDLKTAHSATADRTITVAAEWLRTGASQRPETVLGRYVRQAQAAGIMEFTDSWVQDAPWYSGPALKTPADRIVQRSAAVPVQIENGARLAKTGRQEEPQWWEPKRWMRLDRIVALSVAAVLIVLIVDTASTYMKKVGQDINKAIDKKKAVPAKPGGARLAGIKNSYLSVVLLASAFFSGLFASFGQGQPLPAEKNIAQQIGIENELNKKIAETETKIQVQLKNVEKAKEIAKAGEEYRFNSMMASKMTSVSFVKDKAGAGPRYQAFFLPDNSANPKIQIDAKKYVALNEQQKLLLFGPNAYMTKYDKISDLAPAVQNDLRKKGWIRGSIKEKDGDIKGVFGLYGDGLVVNSKYEPMILFRLDGSVPYSSTNYVFDAGQGKLDAGSIEEAARWLRIHRFLPTDFKLRITEEKYQEKVAYFKDLFKGEKDAEKRQAAAVAGWLYTDDKGRRYTWVDGDKVYGQAVLRIGAKRFPDLLVVHGTHAWTRPADEKGNQVRIESSWNGSSSRIWVDPFYYGPRLMQASNIELSGGIASLDAPDDQAPRVDIKLAKKRFNESTTQKDKEYWLGQVKLAQSQTWWIGTPAEEQQKLDKLGDELRDYLEQLRELKELRGLQKLDGSNKPGARLSRSFHEGNFGRDYQAEIRKEDGINKLVLTFSRDFGALVVDDGVSQTSYRKLKIPIVGPGTYKMTDTIYGKSFIVTVKVDSKSKKYNIKISENTLSKKAKEVRTGFVKRRDSASAKKAKPGFFFSLGITISNEIRKVLGLQKGRTPGDLRLGLSDSDEDLPVSWNPDMDSKGARLASDTGNNPENSNRERNPLQHLVGHPLFLAGFSLTLMAAMGFFFGPVAFLVSLNPFILVGLTGLLQDMVGLKASDSKFYVDRFEALPEGAEYPTATIAIPFFKEPFETVKETVLQAKKAIDHYNDRAGTIKANLVIFEDGLQVISQEERDARIEFYKKNGVAYIARPPNQQGVYTRTGMFKKASNLNNGHRLDREIRARMAAHSISYEQALEELKSGPVNPDTRDDLLQTSGNILLGDVILFLDNDSYVPAEGLTYSVHALLNRPNAGFIQHASSPTNKDYNLLTRVHAVAARSFWRFTLKVRSVYAPASILGHNIAIRKKALEEVMDESQEPAPWHEGRGADDLVTGIAIRNTSSHFYGVLADLPFADGGFKEGLPQSYTEIAGQLRRYGSTATGSIFNPITEWFSKGVFRPEYRTLLASRGKEQTPVTLGEKFDQFLWAMGGLQTVVLLFVPFFYVAAAIFVSHAAGAALAMGALVGGLTPVILTVYFLYHSTSTQRYEFINTFLYAPFLYLCLTVQFAIGTFYDMFLARAKVYRTTAIGDLKDDSFFTAAKASFKANRTQLLIGAGTLASGILILSALPVAAGTVMLSSFLFVVSAALILSPFIYEKKIKEDSLGFEQYPQTVWRMPSFVRLAVIPLIFFFIFSFLSPTFISRDETSAPQPRPQAQVKIDRLKREVFRNGDFLIQRTHRGFYLYVKGEERDHYEVIGDSAEIPKNYNWEFFLRHGVASFNPETGEARPVPGVWLSTQSPFPPSHNLEVLNQLKVLTIEAQKRKPENREIAEAIRFIDNAIAVQSRKPKRGEPGFDKKTSDGARLAAFDPMSIKSPVLSVLPNAEKERIDAIVRFVEHIRPILYGQKPVDGFEGIPAEKIRFLIDRLMPDRGNLLYFDQVLSAAVAGEPAVIILFSENHPVGKTFKVTTQFTNRVLMEARARGISVDPLHAGAMNNAETSLRQIVANEATARTFARRYAQGILESRMQVKGSPVQVAMATNLFKNGIDMIALLAQRNDGSSESRNAQIFLEEFLSVFSDPADPIQAAWAMRSVFRFNDSIVTGFLNPSDKATAKTQIVYLFSGAEYLYQMARRIAEKKGLDVSKIKPLFINRRLLARYKAENPQALSAYLTGTGMADAERLVIVDTGFRGSEADEIEAILAKSSPNPKRKVYTRLLLYQDPVLEVMSPITSGRDAKKLGWNNYVVTIFDRTVNYGNPAQHLIASQRANWLGLLASWLDDGFPKETKSPTILLSDAPGHIIVQPETTELTVFAGILKKFIDETTDRLIENPGNPAQEFFPPDDALNAIWVPGGIGAAKNLVTDLRNTDPSRGGREPILLSGMSTAERGYVLEALRRHLEANPDSRAFWIPSASKQLALRVSKKLPIKPGFGASLLGAKPQQPAPTIAMVGTMVEIQINAISVDAALADITTLAAKYSAMPYIQGTAYRFQESDLQSMGARLASDMTRRGLFKTVGMLAGAAALSVLPDSLTRAQEEKAPENPFHEKDADLGVQYNELIAKINAGEKPAADKFIAEYVSRARHLLETVDHKKADPNDIEYARFKRLMGIIFLRKLMDKILAPVIKGEVVVSNKSLKMTALLMRDYYGAMPISDDFDGFRKAVWAGDLQFLVDILPMADKDARFRLSREAAISLLARGAHAFERSYTHQMSAASDDTDAMMTSGFIYNENTFATILTHLVIRAADEGRVGKTDIRKLYTDEIGRMEAASKKNDTSEMIVSLSRLAGLRSVIARLIFKRDDFQPSRDFLGESDKKIVLLTEKAFSDVSDGIKNAIKADSIAVDVQYTQVVLLQNLLTAAKAFGLRSKPVDKWGPPNDLFRKGLKEIIQKIENESMPFLTKHLKERQTYLAGTSFKRNDRDTSVGEEIVRGSSVSIVYRYALLMLEYGKDPLDALLLICQFEGKQGIGTTWGLVKNMDESASAAREKLRKALKAKGYNLPGGARLASFPRTVQKLRAVLDTLPVEAKSQFIKRALGEEEQAWLDQMHTPNMDYWLKFTEAVNAAGNPVARLKEPMNNRQRVRFLNALYTLETMASYANMVDLEDLIPIKKERVRFQRRLEKSLDDFRTVYANFRFGSSSDKLSDLYQKIKVDDPRLLKNLERFSDMEGARLASNARALTANEIVGIINAYPTLGVKPEEPLPHDDVFFIRPLTDEAAGIYAFYAIAYGRQGDTLTDQGALFCSYVVLQDRLTGRAAMIHTSNDLSESFAVSSYRKALTGIGVDADNLDYISANVRAIVLFPQSPDPLDPILKAEPTRLIQEQALDSLGIDRYPTQSYVSRTDEWVHFFPRERWLLWMRPDTILSGLFFDELEGLRKNTGARLAVSSIPRPTVDKQIDPDKALLWVEAQPESVRELMKFILSQVRYISQTEFEQGLQQAVDDFNERFKKPYFALVPEGGAAFNSNSWVYRLALEKGLRPPAALLTAQSLIDHPGIEDVLLIDDAAYSGEQLAVLLENNIIGHTPKKMNIHVVVPFATGYAVDRVSGKEGLANIEFYKHSEIESIAKIMEKHGQEHRQKYEEFLKPNFDVDQITLTYFQHKLPDRFSFFEAVREGYVFKEDGTLDWTREIPIIPKNLFGYENVSAGARMAADFPFLASGLSLREWPGNEAKVSLEADGARLATVGQAADLEEAKTLIDKTIQWIVGLGIFSDPDRQVLEQYAAAVTNAQEASPGAGNWLSKSIMSDAARTQSVYIKSRDILRFMDILGSRNIDSLAPMQKSVFIERLASDIVREAWGWRLMSTGQMDAAKEKKAGNLETITKVFAQEIFTVIPNLGDPAFRGLMDRRRDFVFGVAAVGIAGESFEAVHEYQFLSQARSKGVYSPDLVDLFFDQNSGVVSLPPGINLKREILNSGGDLKQIVLMEMTYRFSGTFSAFSRGVKTFQLYEAGYLYGIFSGAVSGKILPDADLLKPAAYNEILGIIFPVVEELINGWGQPSVTAARLAKKKKNSVLDLLNGASLEKVETAVAELRTRKMEGAKVGSDKAEVLLREELKYLIKQRIGSSEKTPDNVIDSALSDLRGMYRGARMASDREEQLDFLQRVFAALGQSGRIAVDESVYILEEKSGSLLIRDSKGDLVLTTGGFKKVSGAGPAAAQNSYQLSQADLQIIFRDAMNKANQVNMPNPSKKVEGVLDLDKIISKDIKGFEQIILPLMLIELEALYKKESSGLNSQIFLKTEDPALKEMVLKAIQDQNRQHLSGFVHFDEDQIQDDYKQNKVFITTPGNALTGRRNFFVQALKEGSIPNFRAMFRLSLAVARVDKLEASGADFQTFTLDLQSVLKQAISDPGKLAQALMGLSQDQAPYALPPIVALDITALIQGARLARKMAEQSA